MASTIAIAAISCIILPSCSNDDNKDVIEGEAKKFIGYWSGSAYDIWRFREDGTCDRSYNAKSFTGHWSYNSKTKTLITDIQEWKWQILNLTDKSWTGKHLGGRGYTYTYEKF